MKAMWRGALCAVGLLSGCGVQVPAEEGAPAEAGLPAEAAQDSGQSERGGLGVEPLTPGRISALATTIDPRRTLAVTDTAILASFSAREVFDQLAALNGPGGFTGVQLFRQLWDTQNPSPGKSDLASVASYAHCTDNGNTLNGAPYVCRPGEGAEADVTTSATLDGYRAVGLFNRFDLASADGTSCGEYRIVFAKTSPNNLGRNFMIFESVLPNPQFAKGLEGCRPVVDFWAALSNDPSPASRADKLHHFYFDGTNGQGTTVSGPVVAIKNYNAGQLRTNQFLRGGQWMLREFKTDRQCTISTTTGTSCVLRFKPVTVKTNPLGVLFNPTSTDSRATAFQDHFVSQVPSLAVDNVNTFNYTVPDTFNSGQSDAQTGSAPDNYLAQFGTASNNFRTRIQNELTALGSPLTPTQVVARAQALSCGGCHQRSSGTPMGGNILFPQSAGFVHSTESLETGPEGQRFVLSPALTGTFLPHRQQVLVNFLDTPALDSVFVKQSVPTTMITGRSTQVSVVFRNTGTYSWSNGQSFQLGAAQPRGNTTWGPSRVDMANTSSDKVDMGETQEFSFVITAPSQPGDYNFQWRMVQGASWFGPVSPVTTIHVVSLSGSCDCPKGQLCPQVECPQ